MQHITREAGIEQLVLLAAGLDTRAYRLGLPAANRVFELDQLDVLAYSNAVMAELGARPRSAPKRRGELTGPWQEALIAAGFDAAMATGWWKDCSST